MKPSQRTSGTFIEESGTITEEVWNIHRGTLEPLQRNSGTFTEELLNLRRGFLEPSQRISGTITEELLTIHRGALEPSQKNWATRLETNWAPGCRAAWEPDSQSSPRVESAFKWIMWHCKTYSWTPTPGKNFIRSNKYLQNYKGE